MGGCRIKRRGREHRTGAVAAGCSLVCNLEAVPIGVLLSHCEVPATCGSLVGDGKLEATSRATFDARRQAFSDVPRPVVSSAKAPAATSR